VRRRKAEQPPVGARRVGNTREEAVTVELAPHPTLLLVELPSAECVGRGTSDGLPVELGAFSGALDAIFPAVSWNADELEASVG
jgi:hypothetical protein